LSPCDTPDADIGQLTDIGISPGGLSRVGAEAAWHAVTSSIAGTPHVRISKDGGRTYPARHARPLPAGPPSQPCTVPVFDPGTDTGRMLALDLDPARGRGTVGPGAQVSAPRQAKNAGTYTFEDVLADLYLTAAVRERLGLRLPADDIQEIFADLEQRGLMFLDGRFALALPSVKGRRPAGA
jgi:hypothetical protein